MKVSFSTLSFLKKQAASWAYQFDVAIVLDSNECAQAMGLGKYELLIAVGVKDEIVCNDHAFEQLRQFKNSHLKEWMFGYFTYDLKNQLEHLASNHPNNIGFPALYFFVPQKLLVIDVDGNIVVGHEWVDEILSATHTQKPIGKPIQLHQQVSKEKYIQQVEQIRTHIEEGDVYELNYCVEFFAEQAQLDSVRIYNELRANSATPFATFLKLYNRFVMGASPERFLSKRGTKLYSQPIKGTVKRGNTIAEDEQLKQALLYSEKERAENLMIVDLVRNDLARSAETGSIKVDELFGIYTFAQVHQMISTVSATLKNDIDSIAAIKHAFPMGSMTGAPKIMAMKLIEQYEQTQRGLYSGAMGYFSPDGDFDLNVVIRSIQYNATTGYVNFEVGSAITYDSVAEDEYEECLLKAKAMRYVLSSEN